MVCISHTSGKDNHVRHQPTFTEQLGIQCFAQGHLDMKLEIELGTVSVPKQPWYLLRLCPRVIIINLTPCVPTLGVK